MMIDPGELGSLTPALEAELRRGFHMGRVRAQVEAKQTAKLNAMQHRALNGVGALLARIPADAYHFWGQRLGYECWQDKQFLHEFLRDNPDCRVNTGGTKEIQVGYVPSRVKFHKTFA